MIIKVIKVITVEHEGPVGVKENQVEKLRLTSCCQPACHFCLCKSTNIIAKNTRNRLDFFLFFINFIIAFKSHYHYYFIVAIDIKKLQSSRVMKPLTGV